MPETPFTPDFSRTHQPGGNLGLHDDAGDAGDRLEGELDLQRLHHRAHHVRKPLQAGFQPNPSAWAELRSPRRRR